MPKQEYPKVTYESHSYWYTYTFVNEKGEEVPAFPLADAAISEAATIIIPPGYLLVTSSPYEEVSE